MKTYLKNSIIYQAFVRNFTPEGTFKSLENKLDYIKSLKTDILYLLPISPIGVDGRKGDLGSPYSISDYRQINPEYGTLDDFKSLINKTHQHGMKIMIDVVFNHTSRDSWILKNHPERMYKNNNGQFANKAGDWSDVYDLDTTNKDLIKYLVDTIELYCSYGVDGFRFDVGSLISKEFYIALMKMLNAKYPETILLCESVHSQFINYIRGVGFNALSDAEIVALGFDLLYTYNTMEYFSKYYSTNNPFYFEIYKGQLELEEASNPKESLRIRGLENHDQPRLIEYTKDINIRKNLLAFPAFMKGPLFIYNGLETKADHHLSLFTKDLLDLSIDKEWLNYVYKIISFKKDDKNLRLNTSIPLVTEGLSLIIENTYENNEKAYGLFNLTPDEIIFEHEGLEDGDYIDYLSNKNITIKNHKVSSIGPLYLFKIE